MNAEEIILMKMADIVFVDKRSFCYWDFLSFEYEGQPYKFKHGTIRNIFSKLQKNGDIEYEYRSGPTFYTLPGVKFGKPMTVNHTEGESSGRLTPKQRTFLQCLREIPMDKPAIHDIRLSFSYNHLSPILSTSSSSSPLIKNIDTRSNKDITLHDIDLGDHTIKTTVHNTSTVSVIVACTLNPIPIDMFGLVKLSSSLARVEDRLQLLVNEYDTAYIQSGRQQYLSLKLNSKIPNHMSWTAKMWHLGKDALTSYSGEKFDMSWEDSLNVFHHVYSKEYAKKMKVRKEVQEYPNKPLKEAVLEKLKDADTDDIID
jgi:hypothetical protein